MNDSAPTAVSFVEMVSVSTIADHWHWYKLTGVMRHICVSGPVRCMSLSPYVTCDITHVTTIDDLSNNQWLHHIMYYVYKPMPMRLI